MKIWTKLMAVTAGIVATAGLCAAQGGNPASGQAGGNTTQNVNVVNTPTVNIGNSPTVSVSSLPSVTLSGTPTVNVGNFPTATAVTIAPSSVTHMGVLPSKHMMLTRNAYTDANCTTKLGIYDAFGNLNCFDLASYPGQILMITDWEWYASGSSGQTCYIGAGVNAPFLSASQAGPDGIAIKSEHMTSGVKYLANPSVFSNCTGVAFFMQGYLLPNS